tara:strand:- start:851 stop:1426 length:576 start_codon:yes stop_codon:yes gene_type:complete
MKNVIKWMMPLSVAILVSSCNAQNNSNHKHEDAQEQQQADTPSGHEAMDMGQETSAKVIVKDDRLNAVYQHYLHLTNALTNSDRAEAKIASLAIETGLQEISKGSKSAKTASQIAESNDLEKQRELYSSLSNDFIPMIKTAGLTSGELYVDFCPMANQNKGAYWLTANKEIKNPYMGSKMMTCGSIKETIK